MMLSINSKKTKVMILHKRAKNVWSLIFISTCEPIEFVQSYTYLGTLISLTGNFSLVFDKAIPIKCFVSHRPTDPFFLEK